MLKVLVWPLHFLCGCVVSSFLSYKKSEQQPVSQLTYDVL